MHELYCSCMLTVPCIRVVTHKPVGSIVFVRVDSDGVPPPWLKIPLPPDSGGSFITGVYSKKVMFLAAMPFSLPYGVSRPRC